MNIFSTLKTYAGKWFVKSERAFDKEEIDAVDRAMVVDSQHGQSVCFMMKGGTQTFIPLDMNCTKATGDSVDLNKARLITLGRAGKADIHRVQC